MVLSVITHSVRSCNLNILQPLPFLGRSFSLPLQNSGEVSGWYTVEDTSCAYVSINTLNFGHCTLISEWNSCGNIATYVIEITVDDDNISTLHYLPKQFIYGILGLNVITSRMAVYIIIY